jgi:cyclase
VIPCLLVRAGQLVKTERFDAPRYVGDPVNAVRIFNDKEVDELVVLDIEARRARRGPDFGYVTQLAGEAFMPICYGGGVDAVDDFSALFRAGVEKVATTTAAVDKPELIREAATRFGSQSIVVGIDVRRSRRGRAEVVVDAGKRATGIDPVRHAVTAQGLGAGEILLTAIDREGTGSGYDLELIESVASAVAVPVIAHGGAGGTADFRAALGAGASAVAAGSMFVFHGRRRAVLISYPSVDEREAL